ncbi:hypothetical protein EIKCOROL_00097 [Eikenella corrodens ATCC 23834]|uniref:Uncharacterized protein n=1 Tax=Eikenella corrodens ATCC 23834 TaxID=546274 RepID=C0DRY1_EIKCO|nr:hypothetical protein EIKCOROL_00097 [Eikenella corrodens ATCC 23834]
MIRRWLALWLAYYLQLAAWFHSYLEQLYNGSGHIVRIIIHHFVYFLNFRKDLFYLNGLIE